MRTKLFFAAIAVCALAALLYFKDSSDDPKKSRLSNEYKQSILKN